MTLHTENTRLECERNNKKNVAFKQYIMYESSLLVLYMRLPCTVSCACSRILPRGFLAMQMYMPVSFNREATILEYRKQCLKRGYIEFGLV